MVLLTILTVAVTGLLIGGVWLLTRVYRVAQVPHSRTPADLGIAFEEVRFPTYNERILYGWWIPNASCPAAEAATVILIHGWGRNVGRMQRYIENLQPRGFNLLAFDARHHGSSDPDGHSTQLKFAQDIQSAVEFVVGLNMDADRLGVLGLSIGGAASIFAAAHEPRIRAVVTVGAPCHPAEIMRHEFSKRRIPHFPFVWLLFRYFELRIGMSLDELAAVNNIGRADARFLIVQGRQDEVVPPVQGEKLFAAATSDSARLWLLDNRGHSDCHREPGYWEEVSGFLAASLPRI